MMFQSFFVLLEEHQQIASPKTQTSEMTRNYLVYDQVFRVCFPRSPPASRRVEVQLAPGRGNTAN